jgi:uncharacterized Zn-finger protein
VIKGKDFNFSTTKSYASSSKLFTVYEFRGSKISRRIVRLLCCQHEGCDKIFREFHVFFNHLRVHTKESPFICDYKGCNFSSKQISNLRKHKE